MKLTKPTFTKNTLFRFLFYFIGLVELALGITLNTKTNLGVSPVISVPYSIAAGLGLNLSIIVFLFYSFLIFLEWLLDRKRFALSDLLQIAMSFGTSYFIGLFDAYIPECPDSYPIRLLVLALALIFTGTGAVLTVITKIVPNPADALAAILGRFTGKSMGFGKNLLDAACLLISLCVGLLLTGHVVGLGFGTVCAVVFTGRVVAVANKLFANDILRLSGLEENN